jgi:hypothetical protein
VKKLRSMIVAAIAVSMLAIPVSAHAAGGNCVGPTMRQFHDQIRSVAKEGSVHDLVESLRTNPELYPWCSG